MWPGLAEGRSIKRRREYIGWEWWRFSNTTALSLFEETAVEEQDLGKDILCS